MGDAELVDLKPQSFMKLNSSRSSQPIESPGEEDPGLRRILIITAASSAAASPVEDYEVICRFFSLSWSAPNWPVR